MSGRMSQEERKELKELSRNPAFSKQLEDLIYASFDSYVHNGEARSNKAAQFDQFQRGIRGLQEEGPLSEGEGGDHGRERRKDVRRVHFIQRAWFRYAAVLLFIAGTAAYFAYLYSTNQKSQEGPDQQELAQQAQDFLPGGNKAVLTLADGRSIVLDSAAVGTLASQGGTRILKLEAGKLAYESGGVNGQAGYNTISTPRGGQYQIVLPDGSIVWLNAASSITFPTAFPKKERRVEIKGEAYLEIAADKGKPFYATVQETEVQVLGTSFNVNAYPEEGAVSTTLVEGAVRVSAYKHVQMLLPGQQALADPRQIRLINNADIEKTLAWKNGLFNFQDASLEDVMRQIARWYDIDVVYEKGIPPIQFEGKMNRDMTLSELLSALGKAGVHFKVEKDRKLIVLP